MVQDFSWKTGAVTLYFEVDAADHVVMKSVRSGEVSRDFARPLPWLRSCLLVLDTGLLAIV